MKQFRPSLRTLLLFAFSLIAILPVLTLGRWVISHTEHTEYHNVEEKHLLVAENMTLALSRYADDLVATLIAVSNLSSSHVDRPIHELMLSQHVERLWIFDPNKQPRYAEVCQDMMPRAFDALPLTRNQKESIEKHSQTDKALFLPALFNAQGKVTVLVIYPSKKTKTLWIAEINMRYLQEIQNKIKFGKQGHAAIVDSEGNILAHPKPEWVSQRKNIAKLSIVKKMMRGETGVATFYSPAKQADMIAGFSTVEKTGWGVMVPQPISELEANISSIRMKVIGIIILGLLFAIVLSYFLSFKLVKPIRELVERVQSIATSNTVTESIFVPMYTTKELYELSSAFSTMTQRLEHKNRTLEYNANHDNLTKLPNRYLLKLIIQKQIDSQHPFPFILLDLDNFKDINDHWSHLHGDELLRVIGIGIQKILKDSGIVARIGGDEFAIILQPNTSDHTLHEIMALLIDMFKGGYTIFDEILHVGCSLGIAYYPKDADHISDLMQCADMAMYTAKKHSEIHWAFYEPSMKILLHKRVEIAQALHEAIDKEQFVLHYQPKVDSVTHQIKGIEALVRWDHPLLGLLYPGDFIQIAEDIGLIVPLGKLIINQVCQDMAMWKSKDVLQFNVAINLSAQQLEDPQLLSSLKRCIEHYQLLPKYIEFEITESALAKNDIHIKHTLKALNEMGCIISIDDFGIGESSLGRLKEYDVDTIKIDKLFIRDIVTNHKSRKLLISIVQMSEILGLNIVVEGVEDIAQLTILQEIYGGVIQGFIYSKAIDKTSIIEVLKRGFIYPHNT